ncbi:MAG: altronate dehydrogenase [Gemmatimonadota bacterium]
MTPDLPETLLQFGCGRFLRAFADLFVHQANADGQAVGRVVAVQSTPGERAAQLNRQGGRYHVAVRGLQGGRVVDEVQPVASLSRALVAADQWEVVRRVACSPDLRWILSNTTEVGLALDPEDAARPGGAPRSFPARLLDLLAARFAAGQPGVPVLACELVDHNGPRLRGLVLEQARAWGLPADLQRWIEGECLFPETLVDRVVSGRPDGHPLLAEDPLLIAAEPFAFWAVQSLPGVRLFDHPCLHVVADVAPYALRKVRILNGAHTALIARGLAERFQTVRQAVGDGEVRAWLRRLLDDEILPAVGDRVEGAAEFADAVLERFANPYLEHRLADIAVHQEAKVRARLLPTWREFRERLGAPPPMLTALLDPYLEE